jgi:hypothetical protein
MRCYNAAMSKPFQFSMRLFFGEIFLACVAAWLVAMLIRFGQHRNLDAMIACLIAIGAVLGTSIGLPLRRAIIGAVVGAVISFVGVVAFLLWVFSSSGFWRG